MIGKQLLHYKILDKLGEGGMGVVYKAHDTKLKRDVAIKFLPRQIAANDEERKRFKIEAQAAAALNHPNIATIHAIEEHEDETFLVMEYIDGKELKEIVEARRAVPLPVDDIFNYATQIASGLEAAHKKGIVHRDIKSSNIMITDEGQVKIMDFGLAKVRGGAEVTKVGTTIGTAAFMSPEQASGEASDHRSDIWSFGVVLYEMLTGQLPFKGDYDQAVIYAILNENPESITELRPEIEEQVELLIDKTLSKNLDDRYQRIQDCLADLQAIRKGEFTLDENRKTTKRRYPLKSRNLWINVASIIAVILIIYFAFILKSPDSKLITDEKSIAVMPFADLSPEKDQAYFADGMAEEIINALTQIPGLKVSARTSAFQFRDQETDIQTIGEKLGVGTILKGSVRKSGSTLRITAQLVNVADGFHLWSESYDRQLTDIFAIQDDLSRSIVSALQVKLSGDETKSLDSRMPANVEAYNLYLKGRYFWNRRSEEALLESIDFFNQAIELDSTYTLAYTGLADSYNMLGAWQLLEPNDTFAKAKAAALQALELDNMNSDGHIALASTKYWYEWDWPGVEKEFKLGLALNPNNASAQMWYAQYLAIHGRHDEARVEIDIALELEPLSLIVNAVSGYLHQLAGQNEKAIEQGLKTLAMDPHFVPTHYFLFQVYLETEKHDKAFIHFIKHYSSHFSLTKTDVEILEKLFKDSGWQGVGGFMIDKLEVMSNEKYVSQLEVSIFHTMIKDYSRALDYLEKGFQLRNSHMAHIGGMATFIDLRGEPRFQAVLKKMGLPQ